MTSLKQHKRAKVLVFATGVNIVFLFFSAAYLGFSGHFFESALYFGAVLASGALVKQPEIVQSGLSFSR